MKTYKLNCTFTVSAYTEVEADTLIEAIEKAEERQGALSFIGCGVDKTEAWMVEEIDGEPKNITVIE